jgi:glycine dehydrogenase subunit 2
LQKYYDLPYPGVCKHECVFSACRQAEKDVHAIDIAKSLIDAGFHPPTVYFPTIVPEALMIEPTETENKETIDAFIDAMITIARTAETQPEKLRSSPDSTPVGRLDETAAARNLDIASIP